MSPARDGDLRRQASGVGGEGAGAAPRPSRWATAATGGALLLVIGTYAMLGPHPVLPTVLALGTVVGTLLPRRLALGSVAQLLYGGMLLVVGVTVVTSAFAPPEPVTVGTLRLGWSASAFAVLAVAVGRLYLATPRGGAPATLAIALFGLAFCGGTVSGPLYPAAVAVFLLAAASARRLADPARAPLRLRPARGLLAISVAVVAAGAMAYGSTIVLPRAHGWLVQRIMHAGRVESGFSTRLWLGSLQGMLLSDRVVLRLRGARTDYLRGVVYTRYERGRWSSPSTDQPRPITVPRSLGASRPQATTAVELVDDERERYFLPLGVRRLAVPTGLAAVRPSGVVEPLGPQPAERYVLERGEPAAFAPAGPSAIDRELPPELQPELAEVAERLVGQVSGDPGLELVAIERGLMSDYRYSLRFERPGLDDPVVEFLLRGRQGHCEYFATAMVLLARARHIPARLVAGYRVTEWSELGGYYLVRERNAHTWVEAWVAGRGWTTFDPTPAAELAHTMPAATPWPSAVVDLLRSYGAAALRWLDQRTLLELLVALSVLIAAAVAVRLFRAWRQRSASAGSLELAPPLPLFVRLCDGLARHGLERARHEPIERLAARVERSSLPAELREPAAAVLRKYAALRYGGRGDAAELGSDADRIVAALRRAPRRR